MVLAQRVGRPRSPGRGFLLTIATLGVYAPYWTVKAHMELFHQFELARERRQDGLGWLGVSLALPVLSFVYLFHFAANVRYLEERIGTKRPLSPAGIVLLVLFGVIFAGLLGGFVGPLLVSAGLEDNAADAILIAGILVTALGALVGLLLIVIAFVQWQNHINRIWRYYDWRMRRSAT